MPSGTKPPSTSAYAILGLLSLRSWTTYEIAQQVRRSLRWFWPRAERRLYDEPKTLVALGWATSETGWTGQRRRTHYAITDAGREALAAWLSEPPAPRALEFEGALKLFFADGGTTEQLTALLRVMAAECEDRLTDLRSQMEGVLAEGGAFPGRAHLSAMSLRAQVDLELALLTWARWAAGEVPQWSSTTDPGAWRAEPLLRELTDRIDRAVPRLAEPSDRA